MAAPKPTAQVRPMVVPRRHRKKVAAVARRKKEFAYRGYSLEELKAMPLPEVLALLPARARRTYVRGPSEEHQSFLTAIVAAGEGQLVRTHRRDIPILPSFVGKKVGIYNGKEFVTVDIKPEMIGHYLGEFALTRKTVVHSGPGVGATRSSKYLPLK